MIQKTCQNGSKTRDYLSGKAEQAISIHLSERSEQSARVVLGNAGSVATACARAPRAGGAKRGKTDRAARNVATTTVKIVLGDGLINSWMSLLAKCALTSSTFASSKSDAEFWVQTGKSG